MSKELTCEYGHECTSSCQNDTDCPCLNDHICSMSDMDYEEASGELENHDCEEGQGGGCVECQVLKNLRDIELKKEKEFVKDDNSICRCPQYPNCPHTDFNLDEAFDTRRDQEGDISNFNK